MREVRVNVFVLSIIHDEQVERIFEAMDVNGDGRIDITEFVAACLVKRQVNETAVKAAFERLDQQRYIIMMCAVEDQKGHIVEYQKIVAKKVQLSIPTADTIVDHYCCKYIPRTTYFVIY